MSAITLIFLLKTTLKLKSWTNSLKITLNSSIFCTKFLNICEYFVRKLLIFQGLLFSCYQGEVSRRSFLPITFCFVLQLTFLCEAVHAARSEIPRIETLDLTVSFLFFGPNLPSDLDSNLKVTITNESSSTFWSFQSLNQRILSVLDDKSAGWISSFALNSKNRHGALRATPMLSSHSPRTHHDVRSKFFSAPQFTTELERL